MTPIQAMNDETWRKIVEMAERELKSKESFPVDPENLATHYGLKAGYGNEMLMRLDKSPTLSFKVKMPQFDTNGDPVGIITFSKKG